MSVRNWIRVGLAVAALTGVAFGLDWVTALVLAYVLWQQEIDGYLWKSLAQMSDREHLIRRIRKLK